MSTFDTVGPSAAEGGRKENTLRKLERMNAALRHGEPDRVPISDFFWGSFVKRWREELGLPADANPYYYYDLDWIATVPNMDPWIRPFETLQETSEEVVVKTGFGAVMHKRFEFPMPEMRSWETDTFEKLERVQFDDPRDRRRFFEAGDNQIAGVGDRFQRDLPPWIESVRSLRPDFPVYGSMIEASECSTRLIGQENSMLWMAEHPQRMGRRHPSDRRGLFVMAQPNWRPRGSAGRLCDLGRRGLQEEHLHVAGLSARVLQPWVARMVELAHAHDVPVIYHGCGNVQAIFSDYIEVGLEAFNPLEVKAGMDAVDLRRRYGHRMAFCGNSDIQIWETGDRDAIRREVLRKLNAAKGGGFIFQSDHSVTSSVSGPTYDYIVQLVRQYGTYPLQLGEFDEDMKPSA